MIRIGRATKHNNEGRGFHAPGTTGPFGGAVAVGRLLKFDAATMTNALGIAGSLSCGLLEFARSGTGAMVKRLHLGRAAESGVLAASLAEAGFTGPHSVLEGPFGFLNVYCGENDVAALTRGLGEEWATLRIMLKRFPVHITSHTSVQAVQDLRREHGYDRSRRRLDPHRRQPEDGDGQQHPGAIRPDDGAVFAAVLRGAGASPRAARSGLVQHEELQRPGDPRARLAVTITVADEARHGHTIASTVTVTLKDGRALDPPCRQLQGHAGAAARPRRDAREVPAADAGLRPRRR